MKRKRNESHTILKYSTVAVFRLFEEIGMNHNMSRIGCFCIYRNLLSKFKEEANHSRLLSKKRHRYTGSNKNPLSTDIGNVSFNDGQPLTRLPYSSYCSKFCSKVFPMMEYSINIAIKNCYLLFMNEIPLR